MKGDVTMTLVPLADCCLQLGIDPKTLRGWLKAAHLFPCLHPADARIKCLTPDQLSRLAALHDRRLLLPADLTLAPPTALMLASDPSAAGTLSDASELRHQLALLQSQVGTLQAQVTELALALLRTSGPSQAQVPPQAPQATQTVPRLSQRPSLPDPKPSRPSSHALPLIEVQPGGTPVIISPTEGVLPLLPDSPEWFAWLASLKSFSLRCSSGHFHAKRRCDHGKRGQLWNLRLALHGSSCDLYLGSTKNLTLAFLQEAAARLYARLTKR
jgi:hypothetical protein